MNEEAQRIAIAEACGLHAYIGVVCDGHTCQTCGKRIEEPGHYVIRPPDYLNDLNAMHEAEKTLRIGVDLHIGQRWFGYLANVVSGKQMYLNEYDWPGAAYFICRATAAQRAEAFLRTIGRWEDGK